MIRNNKKIFLNVAIIMCFFVVSTQIVSAQRGGSGTRPTRAPRVTPTSTPNPPSGETDISFYMDIDNDGDIDIFDYAVFVGEYLWVGPAGGNPADFNKDGFVNDSDLALLSDVYGTPPAPQWVTDEDAQSYCTNDGLVEISVSFTNEETLADRAMNVFATDTQTSTTIDLGIVSPQGETSGVIQTGLASINAGVVVFDLSWVNGDPRVDTRYASYEAISCGGITPTITASPTPSITVTPTPVPQACAVAPSVLTFDTIPGEVNAEFIEISNQYPGVTFSTVCDDFNADSVLLSRSGYPLSGYVNTTNNDSDSPSSGESFGDWFVNASNMSSSSYNGPCKIVMEYDEDYRSKLVSYDVLDIDSERGNWLINAIENPYTGYETELIISTAYDANDNIINTVTVQSPIAVLGEPIPTEEEALEYDGRAQQVVHQSLNEDIARVEVQMYSSRPTTPGVLGPPPLP